MLWGPRDPVFGERYLATCATGCRTRGCTATRAPRHLVTEDAPQYAAAVAQWVRDLDEPTPPPAPAPPEPAAAPLWAALDRARRTTSPPPSSRWAAPPSAGRRWPAACVSSPPGWPPPGVRPGHRVALLVPPSADLTAAVYAVWRAGAVVVVADKGLGFAGMRPGPPQRLGRPRDRRRPRPRRRAADGAARIADRRRHSGGRVQRRSLGVDHDLDGLALAGSVPPLPEEPSPDADCAVVFTSGRHRPGQGRRLPPPAGAAPSSTCSARPTRITPDDRLVAAFAPFALLGPALGIGSAVPDIDVTAPGTLTAAALADAVGGRRRARWCSPPPPRCATSWRPPPPLTGAQRAALGRVRLLMSAGAPVPVALLRRLQRLLPGRRAAHAVRDDRGAAGHRRLARRRSTRPGPGNGVCVGRPLPGVEVAAQPAGGRRRRGRRADRPSRG